jgi:glycosyltransferase involved in cell wall biosynthesis
MKLSVLILTLNEECCLQAAIESVKNWSDDIVVLDSGSTDTTEAIARSYQNVRFMQNEFVDFSAQRNTGMHSIDYKNEWLLLLDADETCPPELLNEITDVIKNVDTETISGIVRRKDFHNGKWIKIHSSGWFERIVRPKKVEFTGIVHEKLHHCGQQVRLDNYIHHFPLAKGIHHWVVRHSDYAKKMAQIELKNSYQLSLPHLLSGNPIKRTEALKALYLRLPGRWLIFFFHRLLLRGGLLGGIDSVQLTILETFYHFLVVANIRMERKKSR